MTELDSLHSSLGEAERYAKELEGKLATANAKIEDISNALSNLLASHWRLVESGDCGNMEVREEPEVIQAMAVLNSLPDRPSA